MLETIANIIKERRLGFAEYHRFCTGTMVQISPFSPGNNPQRSFVPVFQIRRLGLKDDMTLPKVTQSRAEAHVTSSSSSSTPSCGSHVTTGETHLLQLKSLSVIWKEKDAY